MYFSRFFIIFTIVSVLFFTLYPQVDLDVAGLFYNEEEGFYLKKHPLFYFLYKAIGPILISTFLALLGYLYYQKREDFRAKYLDKKAVLFLFVFLLIGPALITNAFFKEVSGRARPAHVVEFGGDKQFTPYYQFTDQCEKNCSFISGHAAAAFFFIAFGYVMRSRKIFLVGLSFGVLMSLTRIVQGGHFFSDVTFAFIINLIILKGVYYLFYKEEALLE